MAALSLTALSLTACTSSTGLEGENIATAQEAFKSHNGLTTNGLTTNGLTTNGLTTNGLHTTALTTTGIAANTNLVELMTDADVQKVFRYIVSCALPSDHQVDVTLQDNTILNFYGSLGLAPDWGTDNATCGAECQSWISGCIISRLNYEGISQDISLRSDTLGTTEEEADFVYPEATYYGDLFPSTLVLYGCTIGGSTTLIQRVCGEDIPDCLVHILGPCTDYCETGPDEVDGHFSNCHDQPVQAQDPGNTYLGSMTVYRP